MQIFLEHYPKKEAIKTILKIEMKLSLLYPLNVIMGEIVLETMYIPLLFNILLSLLILIKQNLGMKIHQYIFPSKLLPNLS